MVFLPLSKQKSTHRNRDTLSECGSTVLLVFTIPGGFLSGKKYKLFTITVHTQKSLKENNKLAHSMQNTHENH